MKFTAIRIAKLLQVKVKGNDLIQVNWALIG